MMLLVGAPGILGGLITQRLMGEENDELNMTDLFWWFWAVTLAFIMAALAGWTPGYVIVIALSAVQVIVFLGRERNVSAFPTQIRIVYLAWALTGLWPTVRLYFYVLLLLGTIMVVFFGRCCITLLLKYMPWNRSRVPRLV
jgi:hypothetical protein